MTRTLAALTAALLTAACGAPPDAPDATLGTAPLTLAAGPDNLCPATISTARAVARPDVCAVAESTDAFQHIVCAAPDPSCVVEYLVTRTGPSSADAQLRVTCDGDAWLVCDYTGEVTATAALTVDTRTEVQRRAADAADGLTVPAGAWSTVELTDQHRAAIVAWLEGGAQ